MVFEVLTVANVKNVTARNSVDSPMLRRKFEVLKLERTLFRDATLCSLIEVHTKTRNMCTFSEALHSD
jgi:hypothetical protein